MCGEEMQENQTYLAELAAPSLAPSAAFLCCWSHSAPQLSKNPGLSLPFPSLVS